MTTTYVSTADAKEEFAELISRVSHYKDHIILTRRGNEVAAIVPLEDLHLLQHQRSKNELEQAVEALQEARNQGTLSLADLKKEVG
jgi:prevent-host-death family protein